MQTSQGYIFCILQHFVTKFCNFTDFDKFFTGIYFFLSKSKISLTCKLSIEKDDLDLLVDALDKDLDYFFDNEEFANDVNDAVDEIEMPRISLSKLRENM